MSRTPDSFASFAPCDPNATAEIEALDILEVADASRTSRMSAMTHPSSIAPFALDVEPSPSSPTSPTSPTSTTRESTIQIARAAGIPSRASRVVVFVVTVGGMCFVAAVLGVMVGYTRPPAPLTEAPALAQPSLGGSHVTPRVAVVTGAREEITSSPILVAGKDAAAAAEPPSVPVSALAAATAPARAAPRAVTTGVLRVPAGVSGVLVDGTPHKSSGGAVAVTCGKHTVKAPGQSSRVVVVPCGGSASL